MLANISYVCKPARAPALAPMQKSTSASIWFAIFSAACWHIRMIEWLLCVTPMLAREKRGAFHSSLYFSWAWGLAFFFGECVSLISAKYHHLFFFINFDSNAIADHQLYKAATTCIWTAYQCAQKLFICLIWLPEAVWGGCHPQQWHYTIILTPQAQVTQYP